MTAPVSSAAQPQHSNLQAKSSPSVWRSYIFVVAACVCWMTVSSAIILVNKHIMVDLGFSYPISVSAMGMACSGFASYLCCKVFRLVKTHSTMSLTSYASVVVPIGVFHAVTLMAGNMVYLLLSVSFIQMLKAFTPIITMIALFSARLETPTSRLIYSVLVISLGTALAAYGEVHMSATGLICMLVAESAEAVRLVMTQTLLLGHQWHPLEGLMWLAPACTAWLVVGIVAFELPTMLTNNSLEIIFAHKLEFLSAMSLGFLVNTSTYAVIKLAGSLTLKVLGMVRNIMLVFIGIVFLKELVTPTQGVGYAVSMAGIVCYNHVKMTQTAAEMQPCDKGTEMVGHDDEHGVVGLDDKTDRMPLLGSQVKEDAQR